MRKNIAALQRPSTSSGLAFGLDKPWLAPLAGYSDLPFRLLCREYGATACETEMISAKGLLYGNSGTMQLLASTDADQPLVIQLFGGEPECLAKALDMLRQRGHVWFDCNMSCPVRKVMRQNAGAALMASLPLALEIALAMLAACRREMDAPPASIGFKLRIPPNGAASLIDFARRLEDAGAAWLTLHPRTAAQGYGGQADWQAIARLQEAVAIPVMASGDLLTAEDGLACLRQTGAAGLMYARGALRNPAIFREHLALLEGGDVPAPCVSDLEKMILRHISLTHNWGHERSAFKKMRSIIPRYARNLPGVAQLRLRICMCEDWAELEAGVKKFLSGERG